MFRAFVYLLFGAAIGGVLGLLFAPRPGDETREQVKDWLDARREEGARAVTELRQRIPEEGRKLTEAIRSGTDRIKRNGRKKTAIKTA